MALKPGRFPTDIDKFDEMICMAYGGYPPLRTTNWGEYRDILLRVYPQLWESCAQATEDDQASYNKNKRHFCTSLAELTIGALMPEPPDAVPHAYNATCAILAAGCLVCQNPPLPSEVQKGFYQCLTLQFEKLDLAMFFNRNWR
jgi:hypothetical protein